MKQRFKCVVFLTLALALLFGSFGTAYAAKPQPSATISFFGDLTYSPWDESYMVSACYTASWQDISAYGYQVFIQKEGDTTETKINQLTFEERTKSGYYSEVGPCDIFGATPGSYKLHLVFLKKNGSPMNKYDVWSAFRTAVPET